SLVATVSQASKEGLMRRFGVAAERMRILPEAPSLVFEPADRKSAAHRESLARYDLTPADRYVLYAGGISPHKNLSTLIEAFANLAADTALRGVRLVLVGDYQRDVFHGCHANLQQQVARLGIQQHVRFTGFVPDEDLKHLYAASRVFALPSYLEGFGLPVVEAMACGAAVAGSRAGSLPEVIGEAGCLFDPHDAGSIEQSLRRLLCDDAYRNELAARGLARAREFSWERSARCALAVFHELGNGHG